MPSTTIHSQSFLNSQVYKSYLLRYTHTTVDWCSAATTLEVEPTTNKNLLITRIGFVTYNPATDFTQTVKVEYYNGSTWTTLIEAIGYAPLVIGSSRIDSFKIGNYDLIHVSMLHRNSMELHSAGSEKIRFSVSDVISGADKFYAGCNVIEYE